VTGGIFIHFSFYVSQRDVTAKVDVPLLVVVGAE
jgi:hypothetical protein